MWELQVVCNAMLGSENPHQLSYALNHDHMSELSGCAVSGQTQQQSDNDGWRVYEE